MVKHSGNKIERYLMQTGSVLHCEAKCGGKDLFGDLINRNNKQP